MVRGQETMHTENPTMEKVRYVEDHTILHEDQKKSHQTCQEMRVGQRNNRKVGFSEEEDDIQEGKGRFQVVRGD